MLLLPGQPLPNPFPPGCSFLVDKPLEWTSFDVVNRVRHALSRRLGIKKIKVGHAGTLDPLASGLLVLCYGTFTKKIEELQAEEKEYTGTIRLGATTPSFDLETEIDQTFPTEHLTEETLDAARRQFLGEIMQRPPVFSAIKVGGKRAYESARRGSELELPARPVFIKEFEIARVALPDVEFRVACGKGTYLRSLARDFGEAVGSGGHLTELRRTRSGGFSVEDAWQVPDLVALLKEPIDV